MICTIGEMNRGITKSLLQPVLPTFTEALVSSLSLPDDSHLSDVGLKTEVLKGRILKAILFPGKEQARSLLNVLYVNQNLLLVIFRY